MNKKYFIYELKKIMVPTAILASLLFLIHLFNLMITGSDPLEVTLDVSTPIIMIVLVIYQFSFMMNRRTTDLYYSLPRSRSELYLTRLLTGIISFVILILLSIFFLFLRNEFVLVSISSFFIKQLLFIMISVGIFCYTAFIYTRANNMIDGIAFIILHIVALPILMMIIYQLYPTLEFTLFLNNQGRAIELNMLMLMIDYASHLDHLPLTYIGTINQYKILYTFLLSLYPLLGFGSIIYIILKENNRKVELASDISESLLGYKILLPMVIFGLILSFEMVTFLLITPILYMGLLYIGDMLLYRKVKLPKKRIYTNIIISFSFMIINLISYFIFE